LSRSRSPLVSRSASPLLREFLLFLASERGLAENSIHAYRRDLEGLEDFLLERGRTLESTDVTDFREYLQEESRQGRSTRTVARRLAAVRVFLRHRMQGGASAHHVLEQLERPKPERSLPKILSRAQVNQLIGAPNPRS